MGYTQADRNLYKVGTYSEPWYGTHGFPHLRPDQGTFRIDANFAVYQDFNGEFNVDFLGTTQHYSQALGESFFTAKTSLIVDGKQVRKTQSADLSPGQTVITLPNVAVLGFTKTRLPHFGRKVQIKVKIDSYFKDGQHPGVNKSGTTRIFNVPIQQHGGPVLRPKK